MGNKQVRGCITFCLKLQEAATDDDEEQQQTHMESRKGKEAGRGGQDDKGKYDEEREQRLELESLRRKYEEHLT